MTKYKDAIVGCAVGDAFSYPFIGMQKKELIKSPVVNMTNGTWSSKTSMLLAIWDCTIRNKSFDKTELMKYLIEYKRGKYSIDGVNTGIGKTTRNAIEKYMETKDIENCGGSLLTDNGSGSLEMMFPIAYFAYINRLKGKDVLELVKTVSSLTHAHEISIIGCYIYALYLLFILRGKDKFASLNMVTCCDFSSFKEEYLELYDRILKNNLKDMHIDNMKNDGYIVSTLENSLYIILNSENYSQSIIGAANMGGQTSTLGSIVGTLAGSIYGLKDIPVDWLQELDGLELLEKYCKTK